MAIQKEQQVPKSTRWARANKERVATAYKARKGTLEGKFISLITTSRYRAKKSGLAHCIDASFVRGLYEFQQGKCALTGGLMLIQAPRRSPEWPYTVSLDRIDSTKGYTKDNVQLVCSGANMMKNTLTMTQLHAFCQAILEQR